MKKLSYEQIENANKAFFGVFLIMFGLYLIRGLTYKEGYQILLQTLTNSPTLKIMIVLVFLFISVSSVWIAIIVRDNQKRRSLLEITTEWTLTILIPTAIHNIFETPLQLFNNPNSITNWIRLIGSIIIIAYNLTKHYGAIKKLVK